MSDEQGKTEKRKKQVLLKQYLVSGAPSGARKVRKSAFIMHTCPKLANEEFLRKFPDCQIWGNTSMTAESDMAKEDMDGRDFWAEKYNWMLIDRKSDDEPLGRF